MKTVLSFIILIVVGSTCFARNLEDMYPKDEGVYVVRGAAQIKAIQKKLEDVDVAYEMGDGYYDVESVKLYLARERSQVLGYIEEYKLSFTESPEYVYVLVRYDVNGKRVGDLEEIRRDPR